MKKNIEIEFKTLLSPEDYHRLKESFFNDAILHDQKNRYFDTINKDLYDRRMTARIRTVNQRSLFTLKQIDPDNQVIEHEIEDQKLQIDDPRIMNLLETLNIPITIIEISRSHTQRLIIVDDAGEWCLDRTDFGHRVDYELEYELINDKLDSQSGLDRFTNFLEAFDIHYQPGQSKFQRSLSY